MEIVEVLTESSELLLSVLVFEIKAGNPISGEELGEAFDALAIGVKGLLPLDDNALEAGDDTVMLGFDLLFSEFCLKSSNSLLTMKETDGFESGSTASTRESR